MKTIENLFVNAIEHWRLNKGIGTAIIPTTVDDRYLILGILQNIYNKSPSIKVNIITSDFIERAQIVEFITHQGNENDEEFIKLLDNKNIKVLTESFVIKMDNYYPPLLCILYHTKKLDEDIFQKFLRLKFKLIVINNRLSVQDMTTLYKYCSVLEDFKQEDVEQLRLSSPVEEEFVPITIKEDSEQSKLLKYYNKYIETSLNIFDNFGIMDQCRVGNTSLNISAIEVCYQIAQSNGWSDTLDMSFEYNRQVDELYNPNHLHDRAKQTYEIIRNRCNFLSDFDDKLEKTLEIVNNNPTAKILVINKRADFANKVTEYINNCSESSICGNYHDKVENIPALDMNGNKILYKSGAKKGQPRELGAQAQKSLFESLFNNGNIRVLSTNNAPDKTLNIKVDIIIITSSQCENVENYLYRLSKVSLSSPLKVYTLFVKNSLEEKKLEERLESETHKIVKNYKNQIISENNSDFVIVD